MSYQHESGRSWRAQMSISKNAPERMGRLVADVGS
jgi:hypothetical protein